MSVALSFQLRVHKWMLACFGAEVTADIPERSHRFLEEALELTQSIGCTRKEAHQLVDYVFDRPAGNPAQEVGGVMLTLAALCDPAGLDMRVDSEKELIRVNQPDVIAKIRLKQQTKPHRSPLPGTGEGAETPLPTSQLTDWEAGEVAKIEARFAEINAVLGDGPREDWMRPLEEEFAFLRGRLSILRTETLQRHVEVHPDNLAVDRFASAMKAKLAQKRDEGRNGWDDKDDCSQLFLSTLLREHVEKGEPLDVGNFAMMLHQRGERIASLLETLEGE
ncbi:hypothetical protein [Rhizobium leguminosarum]|uniref:hypothetical protein n=1 Tax=Rhizobium leguminosarum TaxID=384 RepID=UPI001AECD4E5|nr:hypothetical protein [Rhizobium leguminosarum]